MDENTNNNNNKRKKLIVILLLIVLLLGIGSCAAVRFCTLQPSDEPTTVGVLPELDGNAEDIVDRESFEQSMQDTADANYFTLQVNPEATTSAQTGETVFEMRNPGENVYPVTFVITLDETGEEIYQSGAVMPNMQISKITLTNPLASGTHKATVRVSIYDNETHEEEGETEVKLTIISA